MVGVRGCECSRRWCDGRVWESELGGGMMVE